MRKIIPLVLTLLLGAASSLAAAPLADHLPSDCIAYVGWAGRTETFDKTKFGKLLQAPAVGQLFKTIQNAIEESADEKDKIAQEHLWKLLEIAWQKPLAISLIGTKETRKGLKPQLAALVDLGKDRAAFEVHLRSLLKIVEAPLSDGQAGELDYQILSAPPGLIGLGYMGNRLFVTIGKDVPALLVAVKPTTSLATNEKFRKALEAVEGPGAMMLDYADMKAMTTVMEAMQPKRPARAKDVPAPEEPNVKDIMKAIGMGNATTSATCIRAVDQDIYSRTHLASAGPREGVLAALLGEALTDADMAQIPADAEVAIAANWSARKAWKEIYALARKYGKDEVPDEKKLKADMKEAMGIDLEQDILAHLGDTWTVSSAPSLGGLATGTILSIEITNPQAVEASVRKMKAHLTPKPATQPREQNVDEWGFRRRQRQAPDVKQFTSSGATIYYITLPNTRAPVSPAWAIHKNRFYFALFPQVISATLQGSKARPLTASSAYTRGRKMLRPNASMIACVDLPRLATHGYPLVLLGWSAACNSAAEINVKLQPDWLPDLPTVQEYLSPVMVAVSSDAAGITLESIGSIPLPISGHQGAGAIVASVVASSISSALADSQRSASMANLKMMGGAFMEFRRSKGRNPEGFAGMIDAGWMPVSVLRSPANKAPAPRMRQGKLEGKSDYVYIYYPKAAATPPTALLIYENPANWNNEGTCIATVAGNAKFVTMDEFRTLRAAATLLQAKQMRDAAKPQ